MSRDEYDLWDFASGLYRQEIVKETCLRLQETANANVNILLWLTWIATSGIRLKRSSLTEALEIVGGRAGDLLLSLRQARSELRSSAGFSQPESQIIRKHILAAELTAEKVLLRRLQDLTVRLPNAEADVEHLTLLDYLQVLEVEKPGEQAAVLLEQSRFYRISAESEACTLH